MQSRSGVTASNTKSDLDLKPRKFMIESFTKYSSMWPGSLQNAVGCFLGFDGLLWDSVGFCWMLFGLSLNLEGFPGFPADVLGTLWPVS